MEISKLGMVLILTLLLSCGVKKGNNTSLIKDTDPVLYSSNEIDFELIKEWVKDKKIVAIGESTHGLGEFFSLKSEIVQYLHKELNFEVLAIEGGFSDINLAWIDVNNLTSEELRNKTLYGNFNCQEIEPLFKYIKENSNSQKPIFYTGFDTEISGDYYTDWINTICVHLNLDIDIKQEFLAYNKMYQASTGADSLNFIKYKASFQNTISDIKNAIVHHKESLKDELKIDDLELRLILRNLDNQYRIVDYDYSDRVNSQNMQQGIANRDKLMAENLQWIIETLYPNKRIIIWAHNGHVEKSGRHKQSTKMMGHYLNQMYSNNYFTIGLFAYKGKSYQHWTGRSIEFENSDSTSIEYIMKRDNYKFTYQLFHNRNKDHWTNKEVNALEIENGGKITFVPSERFDAAINIYSGDIPTFVK